MTVLAKLRALLPPITIGFVLRALLGALLFLCGILYARWLIFRVRRRAQAPEGP